MKIYIRTSESIFGMAYNRKDILDKAFHKSERIQEHVLKCVIYSKDYPDYKHWIDEELAVFFSEINDMQPKRGFRVKDNDYMNNMFSAFGDDLDDAKREVEIFHRDYVEKHPDPYPDFRITRDLYTTYFNAWRELYQNIRGKIGTYTKEVSREAFSKLIHEALDKYCQSAPWIK